MGSAVTEEQAISRAQYLDLFYSQSGTLNDLIPQAPRPSTDPTKPSVEVPVDEIVGSIQSPSTAKPAKKTQNTTPSTPKVSTEVNSIQSTQTSGNKNKGKNRNKKPGNQQEAPQSIHNDNNIGKRKDKYPCLLCGVTTSQRSVPIRTKSPSF